MKMLIDDLQLRDPITAFNGGLFVRPDLSVIRRTSRPARGGAVGDRHPVERRA